MHAQVYCTDYSWTQAYPMKAEGEVHQTLSLLFKDVCIPNQMVMDGAKTQTLGKFCHKVRETLIAELNKPNHIALSRTLRKALYAN